MPALRTCARHFPLGSLLKVAITIPYWSRVEAATWDSAEALATNAEVNFGKKLNISTPPPLPKCCTSVPMLIPGKSTLGVLTGAPV
jgi:hypothetical protein